MEEFLNQYGYLALLMGTFVEGETAILVASSLIHTGLFKIPWTIMAGFGGSFISDWVYYLIGRFNGKYFVEKRPALKAKVRPLQDFFHRHKIQILFSYRFLYGFRIVIPVVIGMSGIKPLNYLGYSLVSGLIWASTVSSIGYMIGYFLEIKTSVFEENIIFIILGFALFGGLIGYVIKRVAETRMHIENAVKHP